MIVFNFLGHFIIGSGVGLATARSPFVFLCIVFGSLLPDIDHPRSILGRCNPVVRWMKHRGHCHTILGVLLLTAPLMFFGIVAYEFIIFGAIVHIFSDKLFSWFPGKKYFELRIW